MNDDSQSRKTVRTFAWASFLNDMGSDMIYPVWPAFVTGVLKADMTVLGLLDGIGEAVVSLSQAASGYVSDRVGRRKPFIWSGYLAAALSRFGYAVSQVWPHLIPFRVLDRLGKIRGAPRDAMVAAVTAEAERGRAFGFIRTMDHLGAVLGILASMALIKLIPLRLIFALAAVPTLFGVGLILARMQESRSRGTGPRPLRAAIPHGGPYRTFLVASCVFALGAFSYSFLLVSATRVGLDMIWGPTIYLIFTVVASAASLPFGRLSDRVGRKAVMGISWLLWGGLCLGLALLPSPATVIVAAVVYGLHRGSFEPVSRALVSDLVPESSRATGLGVYQMAIGLSALPASLAAGILWDRLGMAAPFILAAVLSFLGFILLLFVRPRTAE